jgi:hypothetical protein
MVAPLVLALTPLLATLAEKGLSLLGNAVLAKGKDVVEKQLGIDLESAVQTEEGLLKLKQLEINHEEFLVDATLRAREAELKEFQLEVQDRGSARAMQSEALKQDDVFSKRFMPYMTIGILTASAAYIGFITFGTIPQSNLRFADTILGFILGTGLTQVMNFFYGSTASSRTKDATINNLIGSNRNADS